MERLRSNARALRGALAAEGFPVAESEMHIVPLITGDERAAMSLCQKALEQGVFAQGIRPPTVPPGSSRLRLAVMASHTASELRMAATVFGKAARSLGLEPAEMGSPLPEQQEQELELAPEEYPAREADTVTVGIARARERRPFDGELAAEAPEAPFDFEREAPSLAWPRRRPPPQAGLESRGQPCEDCSSRAPTPARARASSRLLSSRRWPRPASRCGPTSRR